MRRSRERAAQAFCYGAAPPYVARERSDAQPRLGSRSGPWPRGSGGYSTNAWDYKYEEESGVQVLDAALHQVGSAGSYYSVGGVAFDPRTRHIFVGELMASLVVLTPQPGPPLTFHQTTVPIGVGIHHLALDPSTETLYVANASSHTLSVIDALANKVVQTVPIGPPGNGYFTTEKTGPGAIAVDPATHQVYVADRGGHTVTVLQGITTEVPGVTSSPAMPATGAGGARWERPPG